MKCSYCGKELQPGVSFCDGCGAKLESQPMMPNQNEMPNYNNPNVGYGNQPPMYQNYGNYQPPKKNNTTMIIIIVVIAVLVIGGGLGAWFLLNDDGKDKGKDKDDQETTEKDDDHDDYDGNLSSKTIKVGNYTIKLPYGYSLSDSSSSSGGTMIDNGNSLMVIMQLPAPLDGVVSQKDSIINNMESGGYAISSFDVKTINGEQVAMMNGSQGGVQFVMIIGQVDSSNCLFFTIGNENGSYVSESTYKLAVDMIKDVKNA